MKTVKPETDLTYDALLLQSNKLKDELEALKQSIEPKGRYHHQEYRHQFDFLVESISSPVYIYDAVSYKFLYCNESALWTYGYSPEEMAGMTPFDLHPPEDFAKLRRFMENNSNHHAAAFTQLTKYNDHRVVEIKSKDIYYDGNAAWLCVINDITDRVHMEEELKGYRRRLDEMVNERTMDMVQTIKKLKDEIAQRKLLEETLRANEERFRDIFEKSLDGLMVVDQKGTVIEWNRSQELIYEVKRPMVVGMKIWDLQFQFETFENRTEKTLKQIKKSWDYFCKTGINPFDTNLHITTIETRDRGHKVLQQSYFAIRTVRGAMMACNSRDITAMRTMEHQILQTQKMDAMGALAGGIAHDFNNMLGGMIGYTELALRSIDKKEALQNHLKEVLRASKRASALVKQILTFSRRETKAKEPVRMADIVEEAVKLLESSLPPSIELSTKLNAPQDYIYADATQIHQVIMNLCTNAAHAMKETGGMIEVRLTKEEVEAGIYKDLTEGTHLRLSISDSGQGIKKELMDKIFEPFFTTKKAGEGTGMGLAVCHGIVKSHNGHISVYSKEGQGTTFSILLPISRDVIHEVEEEGVEIPGGKEGILLVEDDAYLAQAMKSILKELGYKVTAVKSGAEALAIFQRVPELFHIIITDYELSKMSGLQLIKKIRTLDGDIPVIICMALSNTLSEKKVKTLNIGAVIDKPIQLEKLATTIRRLLTKRTADQTNAKKNDNKER